MVADGSKIDRQFLMTGEGYKASLRDGRVVFSRGEAIEDVTRHPATAGGIETIAGLYDQQHDPKLEDTLTYKRDDGGRVGISFYVARTKQELAHRRVAVEHVSRETFGFFGRGNDMIAMAVVGMVAEYPTFKRLAPEYADNLLSYRHYAEERNLLLAETIAEPQGFRARTTGTPRETKAPDRVVTRITRETNKGIWISGIKAVGTAAPNAHEVMIGRPYPSPNDEECFWAMVALNAPGVKMFTREILANPGASRADHPITARGEEQECLITFDDVFVPRERVFSASNKAAHDPKLFLRLARLEHWYTLVRMMVKSELYVGLAHILCDTLDIAGSQVVRQRVAEIVEYAQVLRGMVVASEELAELTDGDVLMPDANMVTSARLYGLERLPHIVHILQDLCGQGLMVRMTDEDLETPAAFGKNLSWFLDQPDVSAKEKNLIMNLVWDVTCSATASRLNIFEHANAQSVPFLRERIYRDYDADELVDFCRGYIGLGKAPKRKEVTTFVRSNATTT